MGAARNADVRQHRTHLDTRADVNSGVESLAMIFLASADSFPNRTALRDAIRTAPGRDDGRLYTAYFCGEQRAKRSES